MRTTLEIPDSLFARAKRAALERRTTLKALVASGLEKELGIRSENEDSRLKEPVLTLKEDSPLYHSPLVQEESDEGKGDAEELDEVYRGR